METIEQPVYTIDYYIQKFERIPDDQWTTEAFIDNVGRCCALGHCGDRDNVQDSPEAMAFSRLCHGDGIIIGVNDGNVNYTEWIARYDLPSLDHPKARILQFLNWLKTQNGN
jgi:hypothetical protein